MDGHGWRAHIEGRLTCCLQLTLCFTAHLLPDYFFKPLKRLTQVMLSNFLKALHFQLGNCLRDQVV